METAGSPEVHCPDKDVELLSRNHIHPVSYNTYRRIPLVIEGLFTEEVMNCVKIADEIAQQAYQCNAGDNYYPGYFSEILLNAKGISLSQVNKWNSRSIDHKHDYTMRELHFFIPYNHYQLSHPSRGEDFIRNMSVSFSDASSQNNRQCGDLIRDKIRLQKIM